MLPICSKQLCKLLQFEQAGMMNIQVFTPHLSFAQLFARLRQDPHMVCPKESFYKSAFLFVDYPKDPDR